MTLLRRTFTLAFSDKVDCVVSWHLARQRLCLKSHILSPPSHPPHTTHFSNTRISYSLTAAAHIIAEAANIVATTFGLTYQQVKMDSHPDPRMRGRLPRFRQPSSSNTTAADSLPDPRMRGRHRQHRRPSSSNNTAAVPRGSTDRTPRTELPFQCGWCWERYLVSDVSFLDTMHICHECIRKRFEKAVESEENYPLKWGNIQLNLADFHHLLSRDLCMRFKAKEAEYLTPVDERIYCTAQHPEEYMTGDLAMVVDPFALPEQHNTTTTSNRPLKECGTYIGRIKVLTGDSGANDVEEQEVKVRCKGCHTVYCLVCAKPYKHGGHQCNGISPAREENEAEVGVPGKDFQYCPSTFCKRKIQLIDGCNHMVCKCGQEFCYVCGQPAPRNSHWDPTRGGCPRYNHPSGTNANWDIGAEYDDALDEVVHQARRREQVRILAEQQRQQHLMNEWRERAQDEVGQGRQGEQNRDVRRNLQHFREQRAALLRADLARQRQHAFNRVGGPGRRNAIAGLPPVQDQAFAVDDLVGFDPFEMWNPEATDDFNAPPDALSIAHNSMLAGGTPLPRHGAQTFNDMPPLRDFGELEAQAPAVQMPGANDSTNMRPRHRRQNAAGFDRNQYPARLPHHQEMQHHHTHHHHTHHHDADQQHTHQQVARPQVTHDHEPFVNMGVLNARAPDFHPAGHQMGLREQTQQPFAQQPAAQPHFNRIAQPLAITSPGIQGSAAAMNLTAQLHRLIVNAGVQVPQQGFPMTLGRMADEVQQLADTARTYGVLESANQFFQSIREPWIARNLNEEAIAVVQRAWDHAVQQNQEARGGAEWSTGVMDYDEEL